MNPAKANTAKRGNAQGSVYQRENGRWTWQVTLGFDSAGKQKRRSGTASSKTEANKALAKVVADHSRGRLVLPDKITVGEWLERWLKDRKPSLADSTHSSYEWLIGKHITPWIGEHRLQALRPTDLRQYYSSLASKQDEKGKLLSARTLRYIHGLIYSALKDALRLEIIERNIADVVRPEVVGEDRNAKASKAWTAAETATFLEANKNDPLHPVFALILALGLRRGEALGLRWEHINLERRTLRVVETLVTVRGRVYSSKPKTRKSRRTLRLPEGIVTMLKTHKATLEATLAKLGIQPTGDWVFTTVAGTPIHPDNLDRSLKRLATHANVRIIRIHDLRHTYTSLARRQGVALEIISEKLGHSRPSFTADVYRHTFEDEHDEATLELSDLTAETGNGEKRKPSKDSNDTEDANDEDRKDEDRKGETTDES
jgi:integrase